MFLLFFLLLIHVIVDFYLQTEKASEEKLEEVIHFKSFYKSRLFKHSIIYVLATLFVFLVYTPNHWTDIVIFIGAGLSHGFIDFIKIKVYQKSNENKYPYIFLIDQLLHLIILIGLSLYIIFYFTLTSLGSSLLSEGLSYTILQYLLAFLLIGKTANVFFKELLGKYKPTELDIEEAKANNFYVFSSNPKAGRTIGILERILLMVSLIVGSYMTIGLILAAKSIARFKTLEVTKFGEYFIIGTMFSILYTIIVYYFVFVLF
ncbi:MAG: DUF3307 domain-containing protein [Tenericutes bacterium]|nr:DUF3307 domain-containing protein [Mycoplasmatota bacterium]